MNNIYEGIKNTLEEAANDNCACCQAETLKWVHDLGWEWITVEGKNAIIRFGFKISDTRLEINNRPGMLANCRLSDGKLEAPAK